jgi:hypothetical protein
MCRRRYWSIVCLRSAREKKHDMEDISYRLVHHKKTWYILYYTTQLFG